MVELEPQRIKRFIKPYRVRPSAKVSLADDFDPESTGGYTREDAGGAQQLLQQGVALLAEYQSRLAAEGRHALLVVLQAMDAAGKDGTIRHVMSGVNPQGVTVHGFKVPSAEELAHDYLWRYAAKMPARGQITIMNRSYYEEVLVVRVHPELLQNQRLPNDSLVATAGSGRRIWDDRYREINDFERYLSGNGFRIVKLFLNLSKEAQRQRFLSRIKEPAKNWKFTAADVRERAFWDDYQHAFSELLSNTSTRWAPWYVIPADHKWFSRIVAAGIIANELIEIDPAYPKVGAEARESLKAAGRQLEADAPKGRRRADKGKAKKRRVA
jgi:PPK2 family polyphosphate:nucleotide phosphotransferase